MAITRAKNRLYLSLNHEGTRGGITQFNKVSRFVEMPNVVAGLEQKIALPENTDDGINLDDADGIVPFYNKESLLDEVIGRRRPVRRWNPRDLPEGDI